MPKITKTQAKRLNEAILAKSRKLFTAGYDSNMQSRMSTADFTKIENIVKKNLKKL